MYIQVNYNIASGKVMMDEKEFIKVLCNLAELKYLQCLGVNNWENYQTLGLFPDDFETLNELINTIESIDI